MEFFKPLTKSAFGVPRKWFLTIISDFQWFLNKFSDYSPSKMIWGFSAIDESLKMRPQYRQGENVKKDKHGALFKYDRIWWQSVSYWVSVHLIRGHSVIKTFMMENVGASIQLRLGKHGDNNLFPFLKLFSMWVMLASESWKEFIWARICMFPPIFSWDELH